MSYPQITKPLFIHHQTLITLQTYNDSTALVAWPSGCQAIAASFDLAFKKKGGGKRLSISILQ